MNNPCGEDNKDSSVNAKVKAKAIHIQNQFWDIPKRIGVVQLE